MGLDFLKASAKRQAAKQRKKDLAFKEELRSRNNWERFSAVWHGWSRPWGEVIRLRERGEDPVEFLASVFDEMAETVQLVKYVSNLADANRKFDPSIFDGTVHESSAYAVKAVISIVDDIVSKRNISKRLARELLNISPLPALERASCAFDLLPNARHWPLTCESCGCIKSPGQFLQAFCEQCENKPSRKSPTYVVRKQEPGVPLAADSSGEPVWSTDVIEAMKGNQRTLLELMNEKGGPVEFTEFAKAKGVGWQAPYDDAAKSLIKAVNKKLEPFPGDLKISRYNHRFVVTHK